jgi:hypothetical protein
MLNCLLDIFKGSLMVFVCCSFVCTLYSCQWVCLQLFLVLRHHCQHLPLHRPGPRNSRCSKCSTAPGGHARSYISAASWRTAPGPPWPSHNWCVASIPCPHLRAVQPSDAALCCPAAILCAASLLLTLLRATYRAWCVHCAGSEARSKVLPPHACLPTPRRRPCTWPHRGYRTTAAVVGSWLQWSR